MLKINSYRLFLLALFFNSSNTLCSSFTQRDGDQNLPSFSLPSSTHNANTPINPSGLGSDMPNNNFDSLLSDLFFANLRNTQQEAAHSEAMESLMREELEFTNALANIIRTWEYNTALLEVNNNTTLPPLLPNIINTSTNISSVVPPMPHCENRESTITFSANADAYNHDIPLFTPDELSSSNTIPSVSPHTNENNQFALSDRNKEKKRTKTYTCPTCNKGFTNPSSFRYHLKTHVPNRAKPYQCHICHKSFAEKGVLKTHIKRHNNEKPFKCDYCPKCFATKQEKVVHHRIHTGEKPFKCDICSKGLSSKAVLKEHLNMHRGKKPHKCTQCEKSFRKKSSLKEHLKLHKDKTPYKCTKCSKAYSTSNGLKYHLKTHNRRKLYTCHYCNATFDKKNEYKKHIVYEEETDEERKCHICKMAYADKYNLKKHNKRAHPTNS